METKWAGSVVIAVAVVLLGCAGARGGAVLQQQDRCTRPTPAPPAGVDPMDLADRQQVLAYARGLDWSEPAAPPTGQTRQLTRRPDPTQPRYILGPEGAVRPERCSYRNPRAALRGGPQAGRIVAKIELESDSSYDKLGLQRPGAGGDFAWFLWVDSLGLHPTHGANIARGVLIPDDATTPALARQVLHRDYGPAYGRRRYAEAMWMFVPTDGHAWVSCELTGCCELTGGFW